MAQQAQEVPKEEPLIEGSYELVITLRDMGFSKKEIKPYYKKYVWYLRIDKDPLEASELVIALAKVNMCSAMIKISRETKKMKPRRN